MIEATGLKKQYQGRLVVDVERISVDRGEILVILGPSGSGKSVLLRLLNLLEPPTDGTIRFAGRPVQDLHRRERVEAARRMAMVFQDPLLFRGLAGENVGYGLKIRGVQAAERKARVDEMLDLVGLKGSGGAHVSTLSGGEAQRVSLARAMVLKPEVLMLDEAFANLDVPTRHSLQRELKGILRGLGMTAVFVTHDQEEAARLGDRILVLYDGAIAQEGSAREIFYQPENEFVARFIGVDNIYDGVVVGSEGGHAQVSVGNAVIEVIADGEKGAKLKLGVRPEDVTLVPPEDRGGLASSRNAFVGTVTEIELRGPLARVRLRCPFELEALVTRRSYEEMEIDVGSRLGARFKTVAVMAIGSEGGAPGSTSDAGEPGAAG